MLIFYTYVYFLGKIQYYFTFIPILYYIIRNFLLYRLQQSADTNTSSPVH